MAAARGVLASVLGMVKGGATHIAVATDHVIESFRNGLWSGYKTAERLRFSFCLRPRSSAWVSLPDQSRLIRLRVGWPRVALR